MLRVVHIVGAMYPGGMENFIMNLYEKIDRDKYQFDFIVHLQKENDYKEQIEAMGGTVYEIPRLTRKPVSSLRMLYKIIKENQYPIVIRHTANAFVIAQLLVAKAAGAKTICHSHNETDPKMLLHKLGKMWMKYACDGRLACSPRAGKWMFGSLDYTVIHNAINIDRFIYDESKADTIRKEFNLEDRHVYGHIANFIKSKNHKYLLAIFAEIVKRDSKAVLICLGEGELRDEIEAEIKRLHLEERVILTGIRHDAECFMSCFDVLIFPSFFEGLPLTLIEAQVAGLPAIISDTITNEVIITDGLISMESIEAQPEEWAVKACGLAVSNKDRTCQIESIQKAGYDMNVLSQWYQKYFDSIVSGDKDDSK